jgi:ankyrin repeat protein
VQNVLVTRRMRKKLQQRLMHAVMFGDDRQVAKALRSGADPSLIDRDHGAPLYQAGIYGRSDAVRLLVRAGADPNAQSVGLGSDGLPLCAAAFWGHTDTVAALLAAGADPNAREADGPGYTASQWAAQGGWVQTLAVLQAAGAVSTTSATRDTTSSS